VLWGLSAAMMACIRNGTQFLLLRLALGSLEAGTFPGIWCVLVVILCLMFLENLCSVYTREAETT
jgi:hypothetical protein